ncbi:MAG: maleylpyruvate isomerase family protein, partial [Actinobacteria bacterium]
MEHPRLLTCLDTDFTRFRQVVARDLTAPVPSCPGWTVDDLVRHVGLVYRHKVEAMRRGLPGEGEWPPAGVEGEETVALLDRGYAELTAEFAARKPDEPSGTWYEPEQTVGFWIRRMAQETVIHRVDAEQALGEPLAEIPDDLALDGVDEVLERF